MDTKILLAVAAAFAVLAVAYLKLTNRLELIENESRFIRQKVATLEREALARDQETFARSESGDKIPGVKFWRDLSTREAGIWMPFSRYEELKERSRNSGSNAATLSRS